jgi:hypothetical protein
MATERNDSDLMRVTKRNWRRGVWKGWEDYVVYISVLQEHDKPTARTFQFMF